MITALSTLTRPQEIDVETLIGVRDVMLGTRVRMDKRDMPSSELQWATAEIDKIIAEAQAQKGE